MFVCLLLILQVVIEVLILTKLCLHSRSFLQNSCLQVHSFYICWRFTQFRPVMKFAPTLKLVQTQQANFNSPLVSVSTGFHCEVCPIFSRCWILRKSNISATFQEKIVLEIPQKNNAPGVNLRRNIAFVLTPIPLPQKNNLASVCNLILSGQRSIKKHKL